MGIYSNLNRMLKLLELTDHDKTTIKAALFILEDFLDLDLVRLERSRSWKKWCKDNS